MFKFVALFCLCSVAYCGDPYPMMMTHDVSDEEWCKTGFYQEPADPCCFYQQCEADKQKAYNRSCFCDDEELFWNTELCACATYWTPGSCNPDLNYLCDNEFDVPMVPCVANPDNNECCLTGIKYDDHTKGYGPLYVKDAYDMTNRKYYIPDWHEYGYCPEPGTFSLKYCACEHLKTECACAHWNFSAPDPLLDDGTYMSEGNCEAGGNGQLVCPQTLSPEPAEIPATQKIFFGKTGTIFGMVDVNFDGTVVTNESPEAKNPMNATIKIEIRDCVLYVWLEYRGVDVHYSLALSDDTRARIQNGEGYKKTFYVVVENGNIIMCFGATFDDGTYGEKRLERELPVGFKLAGNKCPFKLGYTRPALYFDFGYCVFGWTYTDWLEYLIDGVVPENPNPGDGSWKVFADWDEENHLYPDPN
ncbi:unnamed protein product [Owenia fusiformis]|uniref:Uncharacterized protein n=1 Tax=Owenia fusiformis TaxID=6347 RepID=A0A8S4NC71_OWEFU|nr:unnamed protein product [Owenia fusiformis]